MSNNDGKQPADGAAGARRACALLGIALCAETTTASMDADSAKVDLKLGFRHAFSPGALLTIHCQVKHGASYKSPQSSERVLKAIVDSATTAAPRRGSKPSLLVLAPPAI